MCGVVGVWRYGPGPGEVDEDEVVRIRESMVHRGPDGEGMWLTRDRKLALGHRRLAIIGLGDQGHQPMELATPCRGPGPLVVSFNGEIYNFRELRSELRSAGHTFAGDSDTEVLLHLYEELGISMVSRLRGMFAFALWDEPAGELHLARDPYGIKPLYVADDGTTLRVASRARALLAGGHVDDRTDDAALAAFFVFGSIPEPRTAWRAIEAVPAGTTVTVGRGGSRRTRRYFSLARRLADAEATGTAESDDAVAIACAESVARHLVADVEVGVFLSSGIDSAAILGLAAGHGQASRAVTLGFDEFQGSPNDEVPLAAAVADRYGALEHRVGRVTGDAFASWVPRMLADMDQPSIDGLNTWMVARLAAGTGLKVALSGIGGDELLGGYSTFTSVPALVRRLGILASVPGAGRVARRLTYPAVRHHSPKIAGVLELAGTVPRAWLLRRAVFLPWELGAIMGDERATSALEKLRLDDVLSSAVEGGPHGAVGTVAALEGGLYLRNQLLRDADWAGMAHSLEIRVPLVDATLLETVAPPLVNRWVPPAGKQALATSPSPPLPPSVANRSKTGFAVPMARWAMSLDGLDEWRKVPGLAYDRCPWARRWAFTVAHAFDMI